ncbi:MAG: TetR family transcriptional regulator, partial [Ruminiclostridium sp.]|nr:TetR family transcriptional regulator [Ruminiclostridium sp.]
MARGDIDKGVIIKKAAEMANETGLDKITLKLLASKLNIKPPSLYNHIKGLEDLRKEVMLYGWRQLEERVIEAAVCITGYDA